MGSAVANYHAHGFRIASDIDLPELVRGDGVPDVVIRRGPAPARLDGSVTRGPRYQATSGQYLLTMPGVARYWVRDGRDVSVEAAPGASDADVRVFLLSGVMGALAHQRGRLAMHASGIEVDGQCVLFAGDSGAGKSTLTAAFHDRGYRVVTDDLSVLSMDDDGGPLVNPGSRHMKLWADALERIGGTLGERRTLRAGMAKYSVALPGDPPAAPLPLGRIFILATKLSETIEFTPLTGRGKIGAIVRETYRRAMMDALDQRAAHFALCTALAPRVPVTMVLRPFYLNQLDRLVDAIEQDFRAPAGALA
jgi:hypothetical protein